MEHEQAATLITDHARGLLDGALADGLDRHIRECDECRSAFEASAAIAREARARGPEFLAPHPPADLVAAYAVGPERMAAADLAAVAAHVRACPVCDAEFATARGALRGAWWRGWRPSVFGTRLGPTRALLGPALAVLAIALVYPAYLGTFRYPESLRDERRARSAADSLRSVIESGDAHREAEGLPGEPGAGAGIVSIVLSGPTRGADAAPTVRRREGRRSIHIVIDDPAVAQWRAAGRRVELTITRRGAAAPEWRLETMADALWDEGLQAAGVVLPADRLPDGAYLLELRAEPGPGSFRAEFLVAPAGQDDVRR